MNKMQNFDIENLERKNIYHVPEDFFAKMQHNVLAEVQQKQAPVIPIGVPAKSRQPWWYGAAAAVALVFGMMFWLNAGDEAPKNTVASKQMETQKATVADQVQNQQTEEAVTVAEVESPKEKEISAPHLTKKKMEYPNDIRTVAKSESNTTRSNRGATPFSASEAQVAEEVIHSLTKDELSDLTILAENDVYLDLYY